MRGDQSDSAGADQGFHICPAADQALTVVGAAEDFIDQVEQGQAGLIRAQGIQ